MFEGGAVGAQPASHYSCSQRPCKTGLGTERSLFSHPFENTALLGADLSAICHASGSADLKEARVPDKDRVKPSPSARVSPQGQVSSHASAASSETELVETEI